MIAVFSDINRSDKLEIKGTEEKKNRVVWINYCDIGKHVLLGSVITCDYVKAFWQISLTFGYFYYVHCKDKIWTLTDNIWKW